MRIEAFQEKYPSTIKAVAARATLTGIKDRRFTERVYAQYAAHKIYKIVNKKTQTTSTKCQ